MAWTTSRPGAYVDEFDAAVVSVNTGTQSFVVQGPHGRQFTVNVNGQTEWDGNVSHQRPDYEQHRADLGHAGPGRQTLDADEVGDSFAERLLCRRPGDVCDAGNGGGDAALICMCAGLLPTTTGISLGQIAKLTLTGNEKYSIYWMHSPLAEFLFNQSLLLAGQRVAVGGPASGAANAQAVTVNRVMLRHGASTARLCRAARMEMPTASRCRSMDLPAC